jgi:CNT family concentrative nucleoside transporter
VFSIIYEYLTKDNRYLCLIGIGVFLLIAFIFSTKKKKINYIRALAAICMQFLLAFFVLKTAIGFKIFAGIAKGFQVLYSFTDAGIGFLFGNLANASGPWGYVFAVKVVPIVIFFGALMAMLYHLGVIQVLVSMIAFVIRPLLGTSGAETLCVTAKSMMGPTEAPLLIKKHLKSMTDSEMFTVMVSGMAMIAASVMAAYGSMGVPLIHMITASIMSIPGSILIAKIMVPETDVPETAAGNKMDTQKDSLNLLDAIAIGTTDGLKLAASVAAMLVAFVSLMAMVDYLLVFFTGFSLNMIFAKLFYFVAALIGVNGADKEAAGTLLGQKLVINEFIAYVNFVKIALAEKSKIVLTYALCGFSNISVIGILIAGIGSMAPTKRAFLTKFGIRALLAGTLVNLINAAIAGLLI